MLELNPEDRAKIEQQKKENEDRYDRLAYAYDFVFRSDHGKLVLNDLKLRCNADSGTIRNLHNPDPNSVLVESGKLAVWNYIKLMLRHENERRNRHKLGQ